jgi:hypothetical protein
LNDHIAELEAKLNSFDLAVRTAALKELMDMLQSGAISVKPEAPIANMHCHTFFSFNAYGLSPTGLAWLAKKEGFQLIGIVDFDVLDAVEEFLSACDMAGIRGTAGVETRVFLPEFATREINSPGEPGVYYHMGIGFTQTESTGQANAILQNMHDRSAERYHEMVARINKHLAPVSVDFKHNILPLTPAGNPTERHIVLAYVQAVNKQVDNQVQFWADKLGATEAEIGKLISDSAKFQNFVRTKLMKKGGVGYIQPSPETFPSVETFHEMIIACGALPCATWLDGTSAGEQAIDELLNMLIDKGAVAMNIIPDRNWNIADPETKRVKVQHLYDVVETAKKLALPLNIGTEMNSFGNKLVDDFDAPELTPIKQAFLDGAHFIYGHTVMQRRFDMGYQSEWAKNHLATRQARNDFYTRVGYLWKPNAQATITKDLSPEAVLKDIDVG